MNEMSPLYRPEDIPALEQKEKKRKAVCLAAALLTLAVCVGCCLAAKTATMAAMEKAAAAACILGGWFVLYWRRFGLQDARQEMIHARRMLAGPAEELAGTVALTGERLRIKSSILVYPLRLEDTERPQLLYVNARVADGLRAALAGGPKTLRLRLVSHYVTAWGEAEEEDAGNAACGADDCGAADHGTGEREAAGRRESVSEVKDLRAADRTQRAASGGSPVVRFLKQAASQLHVYVFWAVISVIFWAWIFTMVNDAPREKKLTLFAYAPVEEHALDLELEKEMPDGIRMIRAHSFDYAVFGTDELLNADLYLVPASAASEYVESFRELTPETAARLTAAAASAQPSGPAAAQAPGDAAQPSGDADAAPKGTLQAASDLVASDLVWQQDGTVYGVLAAAPGQAGAASAWIAYDPAQTYYLFIGAQSVHAAMPDAAAAEQGKDDAAIELAERILRMR